MYGFHAALVRLITYLGISLYRMQIGFRSTYEVLTGGLAHLPLDNVGDVERASGITTRYCR